MEKNYPAQRSFSLKAKEDLSSDMAVISILFEIFVMAYAHDTSMAAAKHKFEKWTNTLTAMNKLPSWIAHFND